MRIFSIFPKKKKTPNNKLPPWKRIPVQKNAFKKIRKTKHLLTPNKFPIYCSDTQETCLNYQSYLQSQHWQNFRKLFYSKTFRKRFHKSCVCCLLPDGPFDLHHRTYQRIGRELLHDVIPVCRKCHDAIHKYIWQKKQGKEYTPWYLGVLLRTKSWKAIRDELRLLIIPQNNNNII